MRVDGGELAITEDIAINPTRDIGKLGDAETKIEHEVNEIGMKNKQIHCILERRPPIILLRNTVLVGFSERGIMIELEKKNLNINSMRKANGIPQ
jgi:hypothetical protein